MMKILASAQAVCIAALVLVAGLRAQSVPAAESALARRAAGDLNRYAADCKAVGYAASAQRAWFEVVGTYDLDNAEARAKLGYLRVGTVWAPPSSRSVLSDRGPAKVARKLDQQWLTLSRALGNLHRRLVGLCETEGDEERAQYHRLKVLRFVPRDKRMIKALELEELAGVYGRPSDLTILRRSVMIEGVVADLRTRRFPVADLGAEDRCVLLDRAAIDYRGVMSANFNLCGTVSKNLLGQLAVTAERALAFNRALFAGYPSFRPSTTLVTTRIFVAQNSEYRRILAANAGNWTAEYAEFMASKTGGCMLGSGADRSKVNVSGGLGYDRNTMVFSLGLNFSRFGSNGLQEGMGHAAAGLFFGESLGGSIDMSRARTSTGKKGGRRASMDAWRSQAIAAAWQRLGTPAARLPLLKIAKIRNEERTKAWAFTDYLLRRDPAQLRILDLTTKTGAKGPEDVTAKFNARSDGLSLADLEREYRSYWTEKTWLREAVDTALKSRDAKAAKLWFKKLSSRRISAGLGPVAWWPTAKVMTKTVTTAIGQMGKGESVLPLFERALTTRSKKPGVAVEEWLSLPGYRDILLHPHVSGMGFVRSKGVTVLLPGPIAADALLISFYPSPGSEAVPPSLALARLGTEMSTFLGGMGVEGETLGYPISLHLFRGADLSESEVSCDVSVSGGKIEGFVYAAEQDEDPRTSAPGMFVFFPQKPLPAGKEIHVSWTLPRGQGKTEPYSFTTR